MGKSKPECRSSVAMHVSKDFMQSSMRRRQNTLRLRHGGVCRQNRMLFQYCDPRSQGLQICACRALHGEGFLLFLPLNKNK
jgi:hypothetical protein